MDMTPQTWPEWYDGRHGGVHRLQIDAAHGVVQGDAAEHPAAAVAHILFGDIGREHGGAVVVLHHKGGEVVLLSLQQHLMSYWKTTAVSRKAL